MEKNGKGKKYYYNNEKLIFERVYLNGKRKEYDIDKLIFIAEYSNGKKYILI